jgi:hypothetical protein
MLMNVSTKVPDADLFRRSLALRQDALARILLVFALALLLICVVAAAVAIIASNIIKPPDIEMLRALFVEDQRIEVRPEPVERAAYLAAILATVPAVLVSALFVQRIDISFGRGNAIVKAGTLLLSLLLAAFFVKSDLMAYLLGNLSAKFDPKANLLNIVLFVVSSFVAALLIFRTTSRSGEGPSRAAALTWQVATFALPAIVLLTAVAIRLRSDTMIYGDPHFEAVFYCMSQVMAGRTLLADLPAQYGLYAELLRPVFLLVGFSVLKFTIVMTVLHAVACLALLGVCMRALRLAWLRVIAVLTLSMLVTSTWIAISDSSVGHEYYQLWPIRFFFPAISLWMFVQGCRNGASQRWVVSLSVVAGIAIVWNLDSGVAVFGALMASMLVRLLPGGSTERGRNVRLLLTSALLPIALVGLFFVFLYFKSDGRIHLTDWVKYQEVFYSTGFGMLPMPRYPHPWMVVLGLYLFGIVGGVWSRLERRPSADWDILLYLSIMGLGLFTYYQGRSHDVVLTFVIWPAILIAFMLADRALRDAQAGSVTPAVAWCAVPIVLFGIVLSLRCLAGIPNLFGSIFVSAKAIAAGRDAPLSAAIAFIDAKVGGDREAVILDRGQSIYFAEAGLASAQPGPGMIETLLKEDRDRFLNGLLTSPVPHVFIKLDPQGRLPEAYSGVLAVYRVADTNRYGLQYLVPRDAPRDRP